MEDEKRKLYLAVEEYFGRKHRMFNPTGTFDKAGRWYPDESERRDCCRQVRSPSRRFPYSLMVHCRTIKHVANLFGVDEREMRKEVRRRETSNERE